MKLVDEKATLQDLRTENNQYIDALDEAENTLDDVYKQKVHQQDNTRMTDQFFSKEFLDWYYKKKDDDTND